MKAEQGATVWLVWHGRQVAAYHDAVDAYAAAMDHIDTEVANGAPFDCRHGRDAAAAGSRLVVWQEFVNWYYDEDGVSHEIDVEAHLIR